MASNIAIISAANRFAFMRTGQLGNPMLEGVTLSGPLGGLVVWADGSTGEPSKVPGEYLYPSYTNQEKLVEAQKDAVRYLKQKGQSWASI